MAEGFSGMNELLAGLRNCPQELKLEVASAVDEAADAMIADVKSVYDDHRFTGNLSKGVGRKRINALTVNVYSRAPHVFLFEFGSYKSGERFWKNGKSTGTMPPHPTFIPAAVRHRRRMHAVFELILREMRVHGMTGRAA